MSRYLLVPIDGGETKTISVPTGLMFSDSSIIQKNVCDIERLRHILRQLHVNGLTETSDGFIKYRDSVIKVSFQSFLIDSCNLNFLKEYEDVYKILRSLSIKL